MTRRAVVRCDGSRSLGFGHVFRTLCLAAELQRHGWEIVYVCRDLEAAPFARVRSQGIPLVQLGADESESEDLRLTTETAHRHQARWVIVDRYQTGEPHLAAWREQGLRVLAIDDICEHPFPVTVLLNQNSHAHELPYRTDASTVRLLGPGFALVREAYRNARPQRPRTPERVHRALVCMGGTDPTDLTTKVVAALLRLEHLQLEVVVGSGYSIERETHARELLGGQRARIQWHRDLPHLADLMREVDLVIAAGGSVTWEICCMGLPMILLAVATNQQGLVASMQKRGAAIALDVSAASSEIELAAALATQLGRIDQLRQRAARAWELVDGLGASRVAEAMEAAA